MQQKKLGTQKVSLQDDKNENKDWKVMYFQSNWLTVLYMNNELIIYDDILQNFSEYILRGPLYSYATIVYDLTI